MSSHKTNGYPEIVDVCVCVWFFFVFFLKSRSTKDGKKQHTSDHESINSLQAKKEHRDFQNCQRERVKNTKCSSLEIVRCNREKKENKRIFICAVATLRWDLLASRQSNGNWEQSLFWNPDRVTGKLRVKDSKTHYAVGQHFLSYPLERSATYRLSSVNTCFMSSIMFAVTCIWFKSKLKVVLFFWNRILV